MVWVFDALIIYPAIEWMERPDNDEVVEVARPVPTPAVQMEKEENLDDEKVSNAMDVDAKRSARATPMTPSPVRRGTRSRAVTQRYTEN